MEGRKKKVTELTDEEKQFMLDYHNELRRKEKGSDMEMLVRLQLYLGAIQVSRSYFGNVNIYEMTDDCCREISTQLCLTGNISLTL